MTSKSFLSSLRTSKEGLYYPHDVLQLWNKVKAEQHPSELNKLKKEIEEARLNEHPRLKSSLN